MKTTKSTKIDEKLKRLHEIDAQMARLRDEVEMLTEHYHVHYTPVEQQRFDTKRFQENHPKMYEMYLTGSSYRRFTYK